MICPGQDNAFANGAARGAGHNEIVQAGPWPKLKEQQQLLVEVL